MFFKIFEIRTSLVVVKNPPFNAGDMGSIPGISELRSHMPWSN